MADGRIFTGRQAKELKLVDALGNYYDALEVAKNVAGLKGEPVVKEYGAPSPWDIFKARVEANTDAAMLQSLVSQLLLTKGVWP